MLGFLKPASLCKRWLPLPKVQVTCLVNHPGALQVKERREANSLLLRLC